MSYFDDPVPGPREAIIEMKASGMCATDLHYSPRGAASSLPSDTIPMLEAAFHRAPGSAPPAITLSGAVLGGSAIAGR